MLKYSCDELSHNHVMKRKLSFFPNRLINIVVRFKVTFNKVAIRRHLTKSCLFLSLHELLANLRLWV